MSDQIIWDGVNAKGSIRRPVGSLVWADMLATKPVFSFEYEDLYYDPASGNTFKDQGIALTAGEAAEVAAFAQTLGPDFAWYQAHKLGEIKGEFAKAAAAMDDSPATERDSWGEQQKEAEAWLQDNTKATPFVDALHAARGLSGETREDLLNKINTKATAFKLAFPVLLGKYHKMLKAAESATTTAELDAIIIDFS